MEKRVILAFALSIAVMYAFSALYRPRTPATPTVANVELPASPSNSSPSAIPATTGSHENERIAVAPATSDDVKSEKIEDLVFETPLYTASFSNLGAVLKSYKLKAYSDGQGRPLELINETAGEKVGWPMLIALMVLFSVLMWIFSGVGFMMTRNPIAHRRAKVIFIICTVYIACCSIVIFVLARHPGLLD